MPNLEKILLRILLKVIAKLVALCGIVLYILFLYGSYHVGWQQSHHIHTSIGSELYYIIDVTIFGMGLPPILLVIYFLILGKTSKDLGMGLIFVSASIVLHYYVTGVAAHTEPIVHVPFQLVELGIVVGIMRYWHTQYRVPLNKSRLAQRRQNSDVE